VLNMSRDTGTAGPRAGDDAIQQFGEDLLACSHRLSRPAPVVHLDRGECLYTCGERANSLYLVQSGQLKLLMLSSCGKACLLGISVRGDLVGESCLLHNERADTAVAMLPSVLRQIPRALFLDALTDRWLAEGCLAYLAARLAEHQQVIANMVTKDSEQRLAATLLRLGRKLGSRSARQLHIEQRITQEELAEMIGTTRSRVGYFLKHFRRLGLIEPRPGSFIAIDEDRLDQYVEAPERPLSRTDAALDLPAIGSRDLQAELVRK
jgi:CRP-like cAMP-binding protein